MTANPTISEKTHRPPARPTCRPVEQEAEDVWSCWHEDHVLLGPGPVAGLLRRRGLVLSVLLGPALLIGLYVNWQAVDRFRLGVVPLEGLWRAAVFAVLAVLLCAARPLGRWVGAQANLWVGLAMAIAVALASGWVHEWLGRPTSIGQYVAQAMGVALAGLALGTQTLPVRYGLAWMMRAVLAVALLGMLVESLNPIQRTEPWLYRLPACGLPLQPDQVAHFWGAAGLTLLALLAEVFGLKHRLLSVLAVPVLLGLAQLGIEHLQRLAGRSFQWHDLTAAGMGIAAGTAGYLGLHLIAWLGRRHARPSGPEPTIWVG